MMAAQNYIARASGTALMLGLMGTMPVAAAPVLFEAGGTSAPSSIQGTVTAFQAALGNPNNGNAPGPLFSGHREINWDGAPPSNANAPGGTPFNVFLNNRGAQFNTPGTGFIQAPPSGGPDNGLVGAFGNSTYGSTFGISVRRATLPRSAAPLPRAFFSSPERTAVPLPKSAALARCLPTLN